jgi:hypothetical protein
MSSKERPPIIASSIEKVVKDDSWSELLQRVHERTKVVLAKTASGTKSKRFSELTDAEQSALIEREIFEMTQTELDIFGEFERDLHIHVDNELLRAIESSSLCTKVHVTNYHQLSNICAETVHAVLQDSPAELASTAKVFLNRPIPLAQRPYIWRSALLVDNIAKECNMSNARLAPTLDVELGRRCHQLLDYFYSDLSSRFRAQAIKSIILNFLRNAGVDLPRNNEEFGPTDKVFFLVLPLMQNLGGGSRPLAKSSSDGANEAEVEPMAGLLVPALSELLKTHLGILPGHSFTRHAPFLDYFKAMLMRKDSFLAKHILNMSSQAGFSQEVVADFDTSSSAGAGAGTGEDSNNSSSEGTGSSYSVAEQLQVSGLAAFSSFTDFLDELLMRGLSGLLSPDTQAFLWDQCFIAGWGRFLSVGLTALLIGARKQILAAGRARSAIEAFYLYARQTATPTLQQLLSTHCEADLSDLFGLGGNFYLGQSEEGSFEVLYNRLVKPPRTHTEPEGQEGTDALVARAGIAPEERHREEPDLLGGKASAREAAEKRAREQQADAERKGREEEKEEEKGKEEKENLQGGDVQDSGGDLADAYRSDWTEMRSSKGTPSTQPAKPETTGPTTISEEEFSEDEAVLREAAAMVMQASARRFLVRRQRNQKRGPWADKNSAPGAEGAGEKSSPEPTSTEVKEEAKAGEKAPGAEGAGEKSSTEPTSTEVKEEVKAGKKADSQASEAPEKYEKSERGMGADTAVESSEQVPAVSLGDEPPAAKLVAAETEDASKKEDSDAAGTGAPTADHTPELKPNNAVPGV